MSTNKKGFELSRPNILLLFVFAGLIAGFLPFFEPERLRNELAANAEAQKAEISATSSGKQTIGPESRLSFVEENSLLAVFDPNNPPPQVIREIKVIVTAYSSSVWETDEDPFITASGITVKEGIVAANFLPFKTKIRIPEIYGEKTFIVEDRMSPQSNYQVDIWFPSHDEALSFGAKTTYIEVLED